MSHASPPAELRVASRRPRAYAARGGLRGAGGRGRGRGRGGVVSGDRWVVDPRRLAFSYLTALDVRDQRERRGAGLGDAAPPDRGGLVGRHPPAAGEPDAAAALDRAPVHPRRAEPEPALPLGRPVAGLRPTPSWPARRSGSTRSFFTVRSAVYLASWALLAGLLARSSARQDRTGDPAEGRRMRATSAWGLIVLGRDDQLRRLRLVDVARSRTGPRRSSASTSGRARLSARSPP